MKAFRLVKDILARYKENVLFSRLLTILGIDVLVKLSGIILLPVYLRLMTQEEYGLYSYIISIILTFSTVLNFGLYIPVSKFYHNYSSQHDRGKLLFTILWVLAVILTVCIIPVYYFKLDYYIIELLFKNSIAYDEYRGIVLLSVIVSICNFMLINFFFTSEKIKQIKRYNISRIILINLLSIAALSIFPMKDSVNLRLTVTYLTELVVFLYFMYYFLRETIPKLDLKLASSSLKLGLPVMISAIFGIVINYSDRFFLEKYTSLKELSIYFLALSCANVIPMVFTSFQNAWLPIFLKERDFEKNIIKTRKLMYTLFSIFIGISILIVVFMKLILVLGIIKQEYNQVMFVLPILLLSQSVSSIVPLYTNYLVYFEKTYIASITGFAISIISLVLSITLIPRFGMYGAATVSFCSNIFYLLIYFLIIKAYKKKYITSTIQV